MDDEKPSYDELPTRLAEAEGTLPELLKRKSKIPVKLIEEGMPAEPDTAYIPWPFDSNPKRKENPTRSAVS